SEGAGGIGLGQGMIQLRRNQPMRVAERVATLDLLSGGRVELGLGEGQGPVELHPFGARVREKRDVWEESVKALVPAFTRETWEWHGTDSDIPARNVLPTPYQNPQPPTRYDSSSISRVAKRGHTGTAETADEV